MSRPWSFPGDGENVLSPLRRWGMRGLCLPTRYQSCCAGEPCPGSSTLLLLHEKWENGTLDLDWNPTDIQEPVPDTPASLPGPVLGDSAKPNPMIPYFAFKRQATLQTSFSPLTNFLNKSSIKTCKARWLYSSDTALSLLILPFSSHNLPHGFLIAIAMPHS